MEPVRIRLLGGFGVQVGERPAAASAWRLRKARSLVKLLALAPGRRLHREQVLDTLWPDLEPAAASNNLHQALHVARRALASAGATSDSVYLRDDQLGLAPAASVWIDVAAFEAAAADARRRREPAAYETALELYAGELLPEDRYEDWAAERRESLAALQRSLLSELARLHETAGALELAIETMRRLLASDPTSEDAHVRLMRLLAGAGRHREALRHYQQLRQALHDDLDVEPSPASERVYQELLTQCTTSASNGSPAEPAPLRLEQRIAFCEVDGGRIAYSVVGHGPPLVLDSGWVSHLEFMWQADPCRRFLTALAESHTLIRWDRRGTGLSDRQRPDRSFEADVRALEAVVSTLGLRRFDLFAACNGSHVGALFASRHPDHIARLVLYGTWAAGPDLASAEVKASLLALIRAHWGLGSRTLADMFVAGEDAKTLDWFAQAQRASAAPEMAADLLAAIYTSDARAVLPTVRVPTLVLHRRADRAVPFRHGCEVAALIPGAVLVPLDGEAHLAYCGHTEPVLQAVSNFLAAPALRAG